MTLETVLEFDEMMSAGFISGASTSLAKLGFYFPRAAVNLSAATKSLDFDSETDSGCAKGDDEDECADSRSIFVNPTSFLASYWCFFVV